MSLNKKEFITQYIISLKERTRKEKEKLNFGFDWIIYQIKFQNGETPIRLPFIRSANIEDFKSKTEPEFGIDLSFFNKEKKILNIFVLKDEPLQYKNWISCNFESDLRRASHPDLTGINVERVNIILAYNKDEDSAGIKCYENFKNSCNKSIYDKTELTFERWNLDKIVEEIENILLTPELMPQHLSGILSYLCSQIKDFEYMSNEWQKQLIPNWKRFITTVFQDNVDESRINLISVALIILFQNKKDSTDSEVGWIDLIEWAALHLWSLYRSLKTEKLKHLVVKFWLNFYINKLEDYHNKNKILFETEHGIKTTRHRITHLMPLNDSLLAYDFISKFGILTLGQADYINENKWDVYFKEKAEELNKFINYNPSTFRPLLDIHHIQIFLIWIIFYFSKYGKLIVDWLLSLENYLMIRRVGDIIPFIEGRNRLDLVIDYSVSSNKPYEYIDDSSYLLMMVLEMCAVIKDENNVNLTEKYFKHIVLGYGDDNNLLTSEENPIDLQSWMPPEKWDERIFLNNLETEGTSINSANFFINIENIKEINNSITDFVSKTVKKFPDNIRDDIPLAVYLLACIKNKSPLPPFFWRKFLYPDLFKKEDLQSDTK